MGNLFFVSRRDNFPVVSGSFSGDTTSFKEFGPISGHRYEIGTLIALAGFAIALLFIRARSQKTAAEALPEAA